ncbi:putative B3 domain-containing protein REM15 [Capsicum galapagoense]
MKIPPKKPHFFKPILPGFKEKLKIPKGFLKYLKGHSHIERAVLKRTGKKWLVKLNGRRLEDGWEKFAGELSLRLGDLVIFRHEGDMEFEVSIFDSSECEREDGAEENNRTPEETSNKFEFKECYRETKAQNHVTVQGFLRFRSGYWMSMSMIHVPKLFARESELSRRKCGIMIRNEERSWPFRLFYRGRRTFIGGEWRKFCAANLLKEGERILFEIFSNGEKPFLCNCFILDNCVIKIQYCSILSQLKMISSFLLILTFLIVCVNFKLDLRGDASLRPEGKKIYLDTEIVSTQGKLNASIKSSIKAASHAKAAAHKSYGHSNFVCTIKPYSLTYGFLCVPKQFACANGLINKKCCLIVNDETQTSWNLRIRSCNTQVYMGEGCRKFIAENCLKEGHHIMFVVVTDGETPIWKFLVVTDELHHLKAVAGRRVKTPDVAALKLQVPASTSADANPHFISTIKSYSITNSALYLPTAFAKSTGLMSGGCEIILIDEKHRSWSMWLGKMDFHFGIRRGWDKFLKANGLQVGDPSLQV